MRCTHCGNDNGKIVNFAGLQFCHECGVSLNGQYELQQELLSYKQIRDYVINRQGLIGWNRWKKDPFKAVNNKYYLTSYGECPNCGRETGEKELWCVMCGEPIPTIKSRIVPYKPKTRRQIIRKQFKQDRTSICPTCGSHNVKVYRKGYNYNEAFWGSMFGMREFRYTAGMNANEAMCHCNNCGREWNSHYDIRKIK